MSEFIDRYTAQKIKDFWMSHNPLRMDEYKEALFSRDVRIADLESREKKMARDLARYREALEYIVLTDENADGKDVEVQGDMFSQMIEKAREALEGNERSVSAEGGKE